MNKSISIIISILLFSTLCKAEPMKDFLLSCAYGTAAGAAIGLVSLAFTEDPNQKTNNIARGASLGLYAGIAFGIYVVYGEPYKQREVSQRIWLEPKWTKKTLDGVSLQSVVLKF